MASPHPTLTAARLRDLLHYDPETGVFTRLKRAGHVLAGAVAGHTTPKGYRMIGVDGHDYMAHRLAYLYMTGTWPPHQIDHRDENKSNNCWVNLRPATQSENMQNRRNARCDNKCGLLGVCRNGSGWRAEIQIDGKVSRPGTRDTPEAAYADYLKEKARLHPFAPARAEE